MRRLPYLVAAAGVLAAAWLIEPHVSSNLFATTGPYTSSAIAANDANDATVGWPAGTGSTGYPLTVGSAVCGPVNGEGIGPAPRSAVSSEFRGRHTPVLVFMVTCTNHDQVRVECRGPTDCVAVEDHSIDRVVIPIVAMILALLLLAGAWAIGPATRTDRRKLVLVIRGSIVIIATLAVTLTPLRQQMDLACIPTPAACYPAPRFPDLPVRAAVATAGVLLGLPLIIRSRQGVPRIAETSMGPA